jgi:uncharacterized protein
LTHSSRAIQAVWGAFIGPLIAIVSFVCSVGNIPLAAVLWSGGISFAGVMAFIFADLVILPLLVIYAKYYGRQFAVRITALMFVAMVLAALIIELLFSALGLIPGGLRPGRSAVFGSLAVDYKLFLNLIGLAVFVTLFGLTFRRGATDPVCRMSVQAEGNPRLVFEGRSFHFCSEPCRTAFQADPARYIKTRRRAGLRSPARS